MSKIPAKSAHQAVPSGASTDQQNQLDSQSPTGNVSAAHSPTQRTMTAEDFWKLFEPNATVLTSYTVGFVLPKGTNSAPDAVMGGSGTLVTIDGTQGVLTAEHVIRALKANRSPVGLILIEREKIQYHQLFFDPTSSQCTLFPNPDDSNKGPDLGFMPLDYQTISAVSGKKSFYNLTMQRDRMLGDPPRPDRGAWFMAGLANEWTKDAETTGRFAKVKEFRGMVGEVRLATSRTTDGFDYRVVDVNLDTQSGWPHDFGGFSGSAIWQVLIQEKGGAMQISDNLLSGVVFYQSDPLQNNGSEIRELTCHGSQSIYRNLIDAVRGTAR